jgi:hypothetical protein
MVQGIKVFNIFFYSFPFAIPAAAALPFLEKERPGNE